MALPPFPGEDFLAHHPPKFEEEWQQIIRNSLLATFFFIVLAPSLVKAYYNSKSSDRSANESSASEDESLLDSMQSGNGKMRLVTRTYINGKEQITTTVDRRETKKTQPNSIGKKKGSTIISEQAVASNDDKAATVPSFAVVLTNVLYLACLVMLIVHSPNNTATARRVFLAPLLKPAETELIIKMATNAAEHSAQIAKEELALLALSHGNDGESKNKSLEKILEWPAGYKKDRLVVP